MSFFSNQHNNDTSIWNSMWNSVYAQYCADHPEADDAMLSPAHAQKLLYFLEHVYKKGDVHLVDGGYYFCPDENMFYPPRVSTKAYTDKQLTLQQCTQQQRLTLLRGVIERYFGLVKRFRMLREPLNIQYIKECDNLWNIACALTNRFGAALTSDNEHNTLLACLRKSKIFVV